MAVRIREAIAVVRCGVVCLQMRCRRQSCGTIVIRTTSTERAGNNDERGKRKRNREPRDQESYLARATVYGRREA